MKYRIAAPNQQILQQGCEVSVWQNTCPCEAGIPNDRRFCVVGSTNIPERILNLYVETYERPLSEPKPLS